VRNEEEGAEVIANSIRARVTAPADVTVELLEQVESGVTRYPASVGLWLLRGALIQLGEDDPRWSLEDAERSYLRAAELAPDDPEPLEELGYYYDCVLDDPARAEPFFRRALAIGGGQSARQGLRDVLKQLKPRRSRPPV